MGEGGFCLPPVGWGSKTYETSDETYIPVRNSSPVGNNSATSDIPCACVSLT